MLHDHELMWAHYAYQYSGVCIGYSFAKLLDNLDDDVSFVRMYYNEAVPIVRHSRQEPPDAAKNGPFLQELPLALREGVEDAFRPGQVRPEFNSSEIAQSAQNAPATPAANRTS